MGAKTSRLPSTRREGEEQGGGGEGGGGGPAQPNDPSASRPTPFIEAPYAGPWAEYQFVDVTAPVLDDVSFASDVSSGSGGGPAPSSSEVTMASTGTRGVLQALEGPYSQGYSLVTLCMLPGGVGWPGGGGGGAGGGGSSASQQRQVFVPGKEVRYQGILCRYEGDPGNEGWNLRAEKSLLQAHQVTPGVVSSEAGPGSQHVERLISRTAQTGGRLLTVQWSGQPLASGSENALGVDVFYEVPDQSLPERSVYQLVTAPATVVKRSLFASKGHVTCDWSGVLTRHLSRGWRLVDIFCEASSAGVSASLSPANAKVHTVWFFEKPESRARDDSAVYEGSIVEHWVDVTSSLSSSSSSSSSPVFSSGPASCLGSGRVDCKKGGSGSIVSKRSFTKRMASLRKKTEEPPPPPPHAECDVKHGSDVKEGVQQKTGTTHPPPPPSSDSGPAEVSEAPNSDRNHVDGPPPSRTGPSQGPGSAGSAGWEGVIRSMGEKGWELASIVNTMDVQAVSGRTKVKVLLVFQRKISLTVAVKGRRTSDGLALRADTGASTSVLCCDLPMMLTGETASHLNPSLAVRLPLSRSASRDHDDFQAGCDDDIPSTIGGSCSRTVSAADLSSLGRGLEGGGYLEPGTGGGGGAAARGRGEEGGLLLQPSLSLGDEGSVGTAGRSSTSSQHSRVTAAEVHVNTYTNEAPSLDSEAANTEEHVTPSSQRSDGDHLSSHGGGVGKDSVGQPAHQAEAGGNCSRQKEAGGDASEVLSSENLTERNSSSSPFNQQSGSSDSPSNQQSVPSKDLNPDKNEANPGSPTLREPMSETFPRTAVQPDENFIEDSQKAEDRNHGVSQGKDVESVCPENIELAEHTPWPSEQTGSREETELGGSQTEDTRVCDRDVNTATEDTAATPPAAAAAANLALEEQQNETE
ncbi:uncharacterized protein LOC143298974 [Babylonia areolata]|uniref:uncharacterized protein LOC143298974 n=1 Tax=Babylonia areolata TaxID=304850 RepID=UPI003FD4219D